VTKGFNQTKGFDYIKTFSLVVKHNTIRVVLAHAIITQWPICQIDVNNSFLDGDFEVCV